MKQTEEPTPTVPKPKRRRVWRILYFFLALCGVLLIAALFIPVLDGPHQRQSRKQAGAVSKLGTINTLQTKYSAAHPDTGFACELALLKPAEPLEDANYDPLGFLETGTWSGYKFTLDNCHAAAHGLVVHYQATAVPESSVTGFQAFCVDESGIIWSDEGGSATTCLASRRPL